MWEGSLLQIATGKLFVRPVYRSNNLRGVLYTNAAIRGENTIETVVGRLLPSTGSYRRPQTLLYEFVERIEQEAHGPNILLSSTAEPYLREFSVVVAFGLNCVCTPDVDLCRRLTSGQRGLSTHAAPNELVRRFFDAESWRSGEELQGLVAFTAKLIGLPRVTFNGVMRALRTYVSGMYRIADDLELAYTLLVASVESLAQDFDGHQSDWESLEQNKKNAMDAALEGADAGVAQRVRAALLSVEHVALARRFREFTIAHTSPDYFRAAETADGLPMGRAEFKDCLISAYQSRSKYVHQLKRLPDGVSLPHRYGEISIEDRFPNLTLQGLARLMRNAIMEFVYRQPTVDAEPYDYRLEREGVVQMRLAPQYWVGGAGGNLQVAGRNKLEGFLEQLSLWMLKEPDAIVTDLRPVFTTVMDMLPTMERRLRRPYLALLVLFNSHASETDRAAISAAVQALITNDLGELSSESLIVHLLDGQIVPWPAEQHAQAIEQYLRRRSSKNGLRFPRLFEAALALELAERYRVAGDLDRARENVSLAVENHPGHARLRGFERQLDLQVPIRWVEIFLPAQTEPLPEAAPA